MNKVKSAIIAVTSINLMVACASAPKQVIEEKKTETVSVKSEFLTHSEIIEFARDAQQVERSKSAGIPFDKLQYDKVIAYEMDDQSREMPTVYNMSKKAFSTRLKKQAVLTQDQVDILTSTLTKSSSYGSATAACFEPKLGIVFFLKDEVQMAIDICMDCNYLKSTLAIPAANSAEMVLDNGERIPQKGFSKTTQVMIIDMSRELGLSYGSFQLKNFGN